MITYFRMKRNEWKVKALFYGTIISLVNNSDEIKEVVTLVKRLYDELKYIPAEDLQKEFISALAEIIHNDGKMEEK